MSKMSTIQMELAEQAYELGFESLDEALANGYEVDYEEKQLVNPYVLLNKAHEDLAKQEKKAKEAKQIEMVYEALNHAKKAIALIYKDENEPIGHPDKDIKDEKVQSYYYAINEMCVELADRNIMLWQKEDDEN